MRQWDCEDHLEAALDQTDSPFVSRHIREALQATAVKRGEVQDA